MCRTIFTRCGLALALITMALFSNGQYNNSPSLKIGDAAPPITVKAWLRGEPVTEFKKGQVYVLDFWATWCGGCIASFPHISAIADKYKDKVSFFSVDSYEEAGDNKDKDPVSVVTQFLKTPQGQRLKLDVCVDGSDKAMFNTWIATLRRNGFPTTFIIDQEGKIAWIDVNLDHLDWALQQVVANKWDRDKAAAIMQQKDAIEDMMFKVFRNKDSDQKKNYEEMLAATLSFDKQFPDRQDAVVFYKFMALAELDKNKVPDLLEKMAADPLSRYIHLADAAGLTLRRTDLSKRDYAAVAKVQERCLLNENAGTGYGGKSVSAYENLASTYDRAGKYANAISSIEKAIAMAVEQKAPADQIKKLQGILNKYKAAVPRSNGPG